MDIKLESQLKHFTAHPAGNPSQNPHSANRYRFPLFCCTVKWSACRIVRAHVLKLCFSFLFFLVKAYLNMLWRILPCCLCMFICVYYPVCGYKDDLLPIVIPVY